MLILSIDTSCDETAAAVTEGTKILSNIIWSQASAHAKFGGVMPSLAQRMHEERIGFVVDKAIKNSKLIINNLDAIAVTVGPGLSIALGVGVDKARGMAKKYNKKLIAVNHLEGHVLSPLAQAYSVERKVNSSAKTKRLTLSSIRFPALGLVVSGGNTILVKINKIGSYETLAQTTDDALGEALDKAARMLGFGYPGGAILEKMSRLRKTSARQSPYYYKLPIPILGHEERKIFTYSGLKTAMMRKIEEIKSKNGELTKEDVYNLAASFQDAAFTHLVRVLRHCMIQDSRFQIQDLLVGGGVAANVELRKRIRKLGKELGILVHFPYSKRLYGDNAAMIGVAANFKAERGEFTDPDKIDRDPRAKLAS